MRYLAHRGLWSELSDRNSMAAFDAAFCSGHGAEIDVRDCAGRLVVSHDPPSLDALPFDDVLALWRERGRPGPLAVNVKADGLQDALGASLEGESDWFAFDMSLPDTLGFRRQQLPYLARVSDLEARPLLHDGAVGLWVDSFEVEWCDPAPLEAEVRARRVVCLVSPELHGRDPRPVWEEWATWDVCRSPNVFLCTDAPADAEGVFA